MKRLIFIILAVLATPLLMQFMPTEVLKLKTFDAFVAPQEPSGNFTVLSITEEDVEREGGYPFPRQRLAEIHKELLAKGATGVGWVISFPQADRLGGDDDFAAALGQGSSVIAMFEDGKGMFPAPTGVVLKGEDIGGILSSGVKQNLSRLTENTLEGIAVAPTELDLLVRRIPLLLRSPDGWVASFGTQVLKSLTGSSTYIITTNENGIQEIAVRGIPPVKTDSLGRKWISWTVPHETSLKEMDVTGRFVFVGVTASGVMPQIATPVGLLEPHYIQAALAESMLVQNSPYIPDYALSAELGIFLITVSLVWVLLNLLSVTWGLVLAGAITASTCYLGVYLIQKGVLIDVTWTIVSQFLTASTAFYLNFRKQFKLRQQIKKQFEHYLDPRQVKLLQKDPKLLKLGGETRYCTFLFTDLRGFTSMSEKLTPEEVTEIMNATLTVQVEEIQRAGGMVDKFIGDACMGIFSAPLDLPEHENRAIEAAVRIQERVKALNGTMEADIAIGVGVQTGWAVIGNMGSSQRFDYTAIGNSVNEAARYESSTKDVGVDIIIGDKTARNCNYLLKELEPIKVKGKANKLQIYTLGSDFDLGLNYRL